MRLRRDVSGAVSVSAIRRLGYERVRQCDSHVRVTTQDNGEDHDVIPMIVDQAKSSLIPRSLVDWAHGTTTLDVQDALVKAGVVEDAALEITRRLERGRSPSSMSILIGATLAGFGLLAVGIGWVKSDVGQVRVDVQANRDRIDAVNARVSENTERLIRIETLLEERLPDRN